MTHAMTLADELCALIDWSRPELAHPAALHAHGDDDGAVRALLAHLRARKGPKLAYTPAYVAQLHAAATPAMRQHAEEQLLKVLERPLVGDVHASPLLSLGDTVYQLAGTRERFLALAEKVAATREAWAQGAWGTTHSICRFLQIVWPLSEFPDEALPVFFLWLHAQQQAEWAWARTWGEGMLGTQGHNWWLHTFGGFWKAGLFFPEIADFAQFASFAPTYLEREMALLMAPDGFTRERSGYHWGTARMFMEYTRLAELNGITFGAAYYRRLEAIANVNWQLVAPDGDVPLVGDTSPCLEPGRLFTQLREDAGRYGVREGKYVAEALNPEWQPACPELLPEWGDNLLTAYRDLEPQAPAGTADTALAESGYYLMRECWTPNADWACLDAGARGNTVTSHDHTALFHLLLYSKGRPILIDNCSGPYGEEPSRLWRVGSFAHNVATVDGEHHLPMRGEWRWDAVVQPTVEAWITEPAYAYFSGVHEGYARPQERVPGVRRKLFYLRGGYWILLDRFTARTPEEAHDYQLHFHLGAPATLGAEGRVVTSGDGGNLLIVPVPGADGAALLEPCPYPLAKYDNPEHLCYTRAGRGHDLFATLLVPFVGTAPTVSVALAAVTADGRTLSPWEATGLEITVDGRRDVYVDLHMQWNLPWQCAGYAGDGRLFHSRV